MKWYFVTLQKDNFNKLFLEELFNICCNNKWLFHDGNITLNNKIIWSRKMRIMQSSRIIVFYYFTVGNIIIHLRESNSIDKWHYVTSYKNSASTHVFKYQYLRKFLCVFLDNEE